MFLKGRLLVRVVPSYSGSLGSNHPSNGQCAKTLHSALFIDPFLIVSWLC